MTVIAWDGNILAADRQCNVGDTIYSVRKLWPLDGGGAIAATGQHRDFLSLSRLLILLVHGVVAEKRRSELWPWVRTRLWPLK